MYEIHFDNLSIPYTIRESKRARRMSLKVDYDNGLQVIIPAGMKVKNLDRLLYERREWILKYLQRMEEIDSHVIKRDFISGEWLPFLGDDYELEVIAPRNSQRTTVTQRDNVIRVRLTADPDHKLSARGPEVRRALEKWYRRQAKNYILARTEALADELGFEFNRIAIKGQRTRWGSCSEQGNLNFNWRLMMAPPDAIDYVIIHELCHLEELNHSPAYWSLLAQFCPDYADWIQWFKENQHYLRL
jgi:hypothetical protein